MRGDLSSHVILQHLMVEQVYVIGHRLLVANNCHQAKDQHEIIFVEIQLASVLVLDYSSSKPLEHLFQLQKFIHFNIRLLVITKPN